jgi:hypothetical protein
MPFHDAAADGSSVAAVFSVAFRADISFISATVCHFVSQMAEHSPAAFISIHTERIIVVISVADEQKKSKHESQLPEVRRKVLRNSHWFQMSKLNGIILTAQNEGANIQMSYPLHVETTKKKTKEETWNEGKTPARSPAVGPRLVAHTPTRALADIDTPAALQARLDPRFNFDDVRR